MDVSQLSGNIASTEWFARSGLPDWEDRSAQAYAQRLVRYISDPSTVRVRVMEEFGWSPPVEQIRSWRADWRRVVDSRRAARAPDAYDDEPDLQPILPDVGVFDTFEEFCANVAARMVEQAVVQPAVPALPPRPVYRGPPAKTLGEIIEQCAALTGISAGDILGRSRKRPAVRARQFTMAVMRARGGSYPQVGRWIGGKDHSTVIHGVDTFFVRGMNDPAYIAAWMVMAPCATKMARSVAELDLIMGGAV